MNHHQPPAIEALRERLGADYAEIDQAAKLLKTTVPQLEKFLLHTHREHDIDLVEAGLEKVGDLPLFIARPHPNGFFEVKLYSSLPRDQWTMPQPAGGKGPAIMICPLCGEETTFTWCMDLDGAEWAECTNCGGRTDQQEIDDANREALPVLVPIQRKVQLPDVPEWQPEPAPTRLDVHAGCAHPDWPGDNWPQDWIDATFEHPDRIQIASFFLEGNAA
jgi:hypothetical protein